jgi:hypothetical protein
VLAEIGEWRGKEQRIAQRGRTKNTDASGIPLH